MVPWPKIFGIKEKRMVFFFRKFFLLGTVNHPPVELALVFVAVGERHCALAD
jgi:hypothetical protein